MKIGIIGYGFVGKAVHSILKDVEVCILDPKHEESVELKDLQDANIIFICVPTPTISTDEKNPGIRLNRCDDSLVLDYIQKLSTYNGVLVVKSTIPLHTVEEIAKIRSRTVVWPELLRECFASQDMTNPSIMVVGAVNYQDFEALESLVINHSTIEWRDPDFEAYDDEEPVTRMKCVTPTEASIFKYAVNAFLATKVLFFHQMYQWLDRRGDAGLWDNISWLLEQEGRVGRSHLQAPGKHGLGYAGTCFPKDVKAFLEQVNHYDITSFPLLQEVDIQNEQIRTKIL